jgi:hypothetical protein
VRRVGQSLRRNEHAGVGEFVGQRVVAAAEIHPLCVGHLLPDRSRLRVAVDQDQVLHAASSDLVFSLAQTAVMKDVETEPPASTSQTKQPPDYRNAEDKP